MGQKKGRVVGHRKLATGRRSGEQKKGIIRAQRSTGMRDDLSGGKGKSVSVVSSPWQGHCDVVRWI